MRLVLGLDHPNSGSATINGKPYHALAQPLRTVGALLEAKSVHSGRSARNHLLFLAQTQGLPRSRVDEVLGLVGLSEVADKRAGSFSLGMSQRLGIAAALLGDPQVLLLDEPVNGLDPEGVLWIRNLMKQLAAEGRTILVSSHLMNEMAVTADYLIVIGRGRLITESSTEDVIARSTAKSVRVRSSRRGAAGRADHRGRRHGGTRRRRRHAGRARRGERRRAAHGHGHGARRGSVSSPRPRRSCCTN